MLTTEEKKGIKKLADAIEDFPKTKSAITDSRALCFALIKFVYGEEIEMEVSNEL